MKFKNSITTYNLTMSALFLSLSLLTKLLSMYFILPVAFGGIGPTGAPEIFLIPIALCFILVEFRYALLVAIVASFSSFLFAPAGEIAVNAYSFLFDYILPYIAMGVFALSRHFMTITNHVKRFFYLNILIFFAFTLVFLCHFCSGILFYRFEMTGFFARRNSIAYLYYFSLVFNLPFGLITYILSAVIINGFYKTFGYYIIANYQNNFTLQKKILKKYLNNNENRNI